MNIGVTVPRDEKLTSSLDRISASKGQRFVPLYARFFNITGTNYNSFTLDHNLHITEVEAAENDDRLVTCKCADGASRDLFFKYSPLLDPLQYLNGKYPANRDVLFGLPDDRIQSSAIPTIRPTLLLHLSKQRSSTSTTSSMGSFLRIPPVREEGVQNRADEIEFLMRVKSRLDKEFVLHLNGTVLVRPPQPISLP